MKALLFLIFLVLLVYLVVRRRGRTRSQGCAGSCDSGPFGAGFYRRDDDKTGND